MENRVTTTATAIATTGVDVNQGAYLVRVHAPRKRISLGREESAGGGNPGKMNEAEAARRGSAAVCTEQSDLHALNAIRVRR